jgi:hypothetical protein
VVPHIDCARAFLTASPIGSVPKWLVELHQKLWGKADLLDAIIRTVTLSKEDLVKLQTQIQGLNPSRSSEFDVQPVKSAFLRSKNDLKDKAPADSNSGCGPTVTADLATTTSAVAHATDVGDLVDLPDSEVDTPILSDDLTPPCTSPNSAQFIAPEPVLALAAEVLEAAPSIFPCNIRYMDLTVLGMRHRPRVPMMMLIRSEWDSLMEIVNSRRKGVQGSIFVTGQPGIGQHICLIYPHRLSKSLKEKLVFYIIPWSFA